LRTASWYESDDQWEIWKYTYSDGNKVREEGPLPGAWNNRAGLKWFDFNSSTTTDKVDMAEELMREILYQLKITNLHLSILTNEEITNVD
jgi:hypothetical protein